MTTTEQKAKALAEALGLDWAEMCEYDRESYKDEVRAQEEAEQVRKIEEEEASEEVSNNGQFGLGA